MNILLAPASAPHRTSRIRVMVVDDAVVVRGLLARWIEAEPDCNRRLAAQRPRSRRSVERVDPDVVMLDIEMPDIDGIAALPLLLGQAARPGRDHGFALTRRHAEISLRALAARRRRLYPEAADDSRSHHRRRSFRRELIDKVRALGCAGNASRRQSAPRPPDGESPRRGADRRSSVGAVPGRSGMTLRPFPLMPPRVLLVGSSTGGPQALTHRPRIAGLIDQAPVLITQHMPPTFTTILAEHLARSSGRPVREARTARRSQPATSISRPAAGICASCAVTARL